MIKSKLFESLSLSDKRAVKRCVEASAAMKKAKRLYEDGEIQAADTEVNAAEDSLDMAGDVPGISEPVKANIEALQNALDQLKTSVGLQDEPDPTQGISDSGIPPAETLTGLDTEPIQQGLTESSKAALRAKLRRAIREAKERKSTRVKSNFINHLEEKKETEYYNSVRAQLREAHLKAKARVLARAKMREARAKEMSKPFYGLNSDEIEVSRKINFKNDKNDGKAALENTISMAAAKKGTDPKRVRWPNKAVNDLESRSNKNMAQNIIYKRAKGTIKESAEKLTENERRAVDKYLGEGKFTIQALKDLGLIES